MYSLICTECGKCFDSPNSNYKTCSTKCRTERSKRTNNQRMAIYRDTTINKYYRQVYYKEHYVPVIKVCKSCGTVLDDGRQNFCLDCLLKDYLHGDHNTARQRLACRGYDKAMILEEIRIRNIV